MVPSRFLLLCPGLRAGRSTASSRACPAARSEHQVARTAPASCSAEGFRHSWFGASWLSFHRDSLKVTRKKRLLLLEVQCVLKKPRGGWWLGSSRPADGHFKLRNGIGYRTGSACWVLVQDRTWAGCELGFCNHLLNSRFSSRAFLQRQDSGAWLVYKFWGLFLPSSAGCLSCTRAEPCFVSVRFEACRSCLGRGRVHLGGVTLSYETRSRMGDGV